MMDFSAGELHTRAVLAQRQREAQSISRLAEYRQPPRGLRATLASRLAHLAVHLDREATGKLVGRHFKVARHF